jgi:hypothetical protein
MREVLEFVRAYDACFLLGLAALTIVLLIYSISTARKLSAFRRRYNTRLTDGSVGEVVDCLSQQTRAISAIETRLDEIGATQAQQGAAIADCVQKIGMVRFDAFDDVGGEQSFALVLLDGNGRGVAVSSLYGRQDSRLYAKGITNGEGERALSDEERAALDKALTAEVQSKAR